MTLNNLFEQCDANDIDLLADGPDLVARGDASLLTPDALDVLRKHKVDILAKLREPTDRQSTLAAGAATGYPAVSIRPGETLMAGRDAWERFTSNAFIADVRAVLSQLERLDAQPSRTKP